MALNRNSVFAHGMKGGILVWLGQPGEGRDELFISLRLNPRDPNSPLAGSMIIASYHIERDYAATVKAARRNLANYPAMSGSRRFLVAALAQLGQLEEAAAELRDWTAAAPDVVNALVRNRLPFIPLEEHEHLLDGLRKAGWQG